MRLVDLTTKPWQLMLPGENEASLNKIIPAKKRQEL